MNRDVDPVLEQPLLELLHEPAARADLAERLRGVAVAGGRDRDERDLDARRAQMRGGELRLRQREPATAAADADQHNATGAGRVARTQRCRGAARARTPSAPATAADVLSASRA